MRPGPNGFSPRRYLLRVQRRLAGCAVLLALPATLLAGGCGADNGPSEPTATTAASSFATTAAATTSPSPPPTTKAALAAADGRKLSTCADGRCEVLVVSGDSLPDPDGNGPIKVSVSDGLVTLSQSGGGIFVTVSGRKGNTEQLNNQIFLITAVDGTRAVLRLRKA